MTGTILYCNCTHCSICPLFHFLLDKKKSNGISHCNGNNNDANKVTLEAMIVVLMKGVIIDEKAN